jgi:hypothetical protein
MTIADFRRLALALEGAEEGSHHGAADFRVGGRIFATLAAADKGYGNVRLSLDQQADFVRELPEIFIPIGGGGFTHIVLAKVHEDVLKGALQAAWKLRRNQNQEAKPPRNSASPSKTIVRKKPSPKKKN